MTGRNLPSYGYLKTYDQLPDSLQTLRRARVFLLLDEHQPTNCHHIASFGYSMQATRRMLRDFCLDQLVYETHHLYQLTAKGEDMMRTIVLDPKLMEYIKQHQFLDMEMTRPTVTRR